MRCYIIELIVLYLVGEMLFCNDVRRIAFSLGTVNLEDTVLCLDLNSVTVIMAIALIVLRMLLQK